MVFYARLTSCLHERCSCSQNMWILGNMLVKVYLGRGTKELRGDQAVWEHTCERPWHLGLQTDLMAVGGGVLHMQELVRVVLGPGLNHWLQESKKSRAAKGGHSPNPDFGPSTLFNPYLGLGCSELRYNKHTAFPPTPGWGAVCEAGTQLVSD